MLTLKINKKDIEITEREDFVRGTVGAKCTVEFDSTAWSNTANTVVFKRYGIKPINIIADSLTPTLTIPYEVLSESGSFKIGVFGTADGIVTPTLWSDEIKVRYGTDTNGTEPTDYTPSEIEQIKSQITDKQGTLTAGENITITEDNVISATVGDVDQTYKSYSSNAQSGTAVAEALTNYEKWEKIIDFTVQEESVQVKIDKDLNGNDFSLKKAYIKTKTLPVAERTDKVLILVTTDKVNTNIWNHGIFTIGNCPIDTENYALSYAMLEKVDNEVVLTENRISANYTNIPEIQMAYGGSYYVLANYNNVIRNKIDCLFIGSYQKVLGIGSHFEMWGVRE